MRRKIYTLLIASISAMTLFAGCSGSSSKEAENDISNENSTEIAEEDPDASSEEATAYDEIIQHLTSGEGYAYVSLDGYDGDILLTTSGTYNDNGMNLAIDADFYIIKDGEAKLIDSIATGGTAYPITIDDGIFYFTTPRQYAELNITETDDGSYKLNYLKKAVIEYDTDGQATYTVEGDISSDDITSEDDFYALYEGAEGKSPVDFTVIE